MAAVVRRMNTLPLWLQITGIVVGVVTGILGTVLGILNVIWRRRDIQSRMNIDYYLGEDPPCEWGREVGSTRESWPRETLLIRVENTGGRNEYVADAYIDVPGVGVVQLFEGPNPAGRSPSKRVSQPGFPLLIVEDLRRVCSGLLEMGCTGTARGELVIRLGRRDLHKSPSRYRTWRAGPRDYVQPCIFIQHYNM